MGARGSIALYYSIKANEKVTVKQIFSGGESILRYKVAIRIRVKKLGVR